MSQEFLSLGRCKQRLPLPPNKPMTNQNIIPPKFTLGGNQFIRLTCRAWAGVTERNRQATPKQTGRSVPSKNDSFPIAQVKPFFPCLLQPIYSSPSPTPRSHMQAEQSSIQLLGGVASDEDPLHPSTLEGMSHGDCCQQTSTADFIKTKTQLQWCGWEDSTLQLCLYKSQGKD